MRKSAVRNILSRLDYDYIKDQVHKIKSKDFNKVTDGASKIIDVVKSNKTFTNLIEDVKTLVNLVKDYARGNYREVPYKSVAAIVFGLIYLLDPFDLIPDFIPGIGYVDDAAVIGLILKFLSDDISRYRDWRVLHRVKSISPIHIN